MPGRLGDLQYTSGMQHPPIPAPLQCPLDGISTVNSRQGRQKHARSGELDPLLIPAYGSTIPTRSSTPTSACSFDAARTPERRPVGSIEFRWSPTITPERPGTVFSDMEFGDYVSRGLRKPTEGPRSFCRNMESSGTFISRTGCKGAGARESEPDPEADPELSAAVDSVFQRVLRQRVVSRQQKCPVSLYDLMEVEESPTARLRARGLMRVPHVAVVGEEVGICSVGEAMEGDGDFADGGIDDDSTEDGQVEVAEESAEEECESKQESAEELDEVDVDEELLDEEGLAGQENLAARRQQGATQRYAHTDDASEHVPVKIEGRKDAQDKSSEDEEAVSWHEDGNWWLGGVPAV